ncbi:hydroxymethylglutaryl-CoA lyase [Nereida sp. MMG025]|uniref:hydroxymethylglutaryl-CoA lyase n=1 Tax=Nereida sp. MMG025 TaxID=2909981 RepID=UPI001F18EAD8|nr:hydroxymethylglutaryl-CoA lyase [Nereida sp. MMG025]MCF6445838.1 hydroxymethylglutaryl-CoA lyase [Nereida sp. MMG025]
MHIEITEVSPRDGLQNEPQPVATEIKVELAKRMIAAGARRFEITSFVSPRAVPRMADAAEVIAQLDAGPDITLQALVPNLRGAERAAQTAVQEWVCFMSATESHSQANSNCSVDEAVARFEPVLALAKAEGKRAVAALAASFGCPFEGVTPVGQTVQVAKKLHALGFSELKLGDTIGTATPSQITQMVHALRAEVPDLDLILHLHDTRGLSLANVLTGINLGITRYESSVGGIGGCPFAPGATGNVSTEDLVHFLHAEGYETGFDLDACIDTGHWLSKALGRPLPARLLKAPPIGTTIPLDGITRAVG